MSVLRKVVFSKLFVEFVGFGRVKTERIDFLEWTQIFKFEIDRMVDEKIINFTASLNSIRSLEVY